MLVAARSQSQSIGVGEMASQIFSSESQHQPHLIIRINYTSNQGWVDWFWRIFVLGQRGPERCRTRSGTSAEWLSCKEFSLGSEQCYLRQSLFSRSFRASSSLDSFQSPCLPTLCFMHARGWCSQRQSIGVGEMARWIFSSESWHQP
jgi:hypothetical protein